MSDEEFVERCLRLIGRLLDRAAITADEAVELQVGLFRSVGRAFPPTRRAA